MKKQPDVVSFIKDVAVTLAALLLLVLLMLSTNANADYNPSTAGVTELATFNATARLTENDDSAVEDTDEIKGWGDRTGTFNAVGPAGNRPTYDADGFDGYPCVQGADSKWFEIANKTLYKNRAAITTVWIGKYVNATPAQGVAANFSGDGSFNIRYSLAISASDQPYMQLRNPDATNNDQFSNDTLSNNTSYSVVSVADLTAGTWVLYVNKVSVHTGSLTGTSNTSNTDSDGNNAYLLATENGNTNTHRGCTAVISILASAPNATVVGTIVDGFMADFAAPPAGGGSSRSMMGIGP